MAFGTMTSRLAFAIETATMAGKSTLALFGNNRQFSLKADASPVTEADLTAEAIVRQRIEATYPGEAVLGEEEGGSEASSTRWVVDPIDGTKSFIAGVPLFATLLSFEEEGEPVLGVAYFPALDETVFAELGGGAQWNGTPCRVKENGDLSLAIVCCGGHSSFARHGRLPGLLRLVETALVTRTWCDAYGHALVATGRADCMIDPAVSRWDISAMSLIVKEAGGKFTDFSGDPRLSTEAVSCTPGLQETVLGAFKS